MAAATPVAIYEKVPPRAAPESFYAPTFKVSIGGAALADEVAWDVTRAVYRDTVDDIDSFDLTVSNWDAATNEPKYEPPARAAPAGLFDPGQELELSMGYVGDVRVMLKGQITTLEPSFPESGAPTLAVRGLNVLHSLRERQHTCSWPNDRDSDIAQQLGRQKPTADRPGLGMEVVIDQAARGREAPGFVFMNNQYDIVFLLELARRNGYTVVVREPDPPKRPRRHLQFGPADSAQAPPSYRLEWGRSLVSFRPTLTTVRQVSSVVVRGWDRRTKKPIEKRATLDDLPAGRRDPLKKFAKAVGTRTEVVTDPPVHTPADAQRRAIGILSRQAGEFIQASGATVGLPDLRAGSIVHIERLGERFSGIYYVTSTTHTIAAGYRTEFQARRIGPLPTERTT